jgi:acyl-CoA synthetase (AMP-forming)/AMP-acid ligase II
VLADAAASHPDRIAVVGTKVRWTYRKLAEMSDRFGAAMLALGLEPLDPVVFQLGKPLPPFRADAPGLETVVRLNAVLRAKKSLMAC